MNLQITLAPDGGLRLVLPQGRALDVGTTAASLRFIQRILTDVKNGRKEQPGYIQEFPTQHVIEIWKREDVRLQVEASKDRLKEMGIEIDKLDISL
jgi:hypothetical protein